MHGQFAVFTFFDLLAAFGIVNNSSFQYVVYNGYLFLVLFLSHSTFLSGPVTSSFSYKFINVKAALGLQPF